MSKQAISAIAQLRPILPASTIVGPSRIRRVPGIPFFRDPDHTVPTLRLYRSLIRSTSSNLRVDQNAEWKALATKVRTDWRKRKGWTSIPQTQAFLDSQREFLGTITSVPSDDLVQLSHKLADQQRRAVLRALPKASPRPNVAGFLRPTFFNPPLPRMKPQPIKLTMMILARVRARERRVGMQKDLLVQAQMLKDEVNFYRRVRDRQGLEDTKEFLLEVRRRQADLQTLFDRQEKRKTSLFSEGLVRRVTKARNARQAFKRQRAEERKGVVAAHKHVVD